MSRNRKKLLPTTGPNNITTQPAKPGVPPPAPAPDVSAPAPLGGLPLSGAGALRLLVALGAGLLLVRDDPAPTKKGSPEGAGPKVETKGKDWMGVLMDMAERGQLGNKKWVPEPWVPTSKADKVVNRFVTL